MNASIRDLKARVDNVEVPEVDVAGLVASGERRLGRRRAAVTAGGVAAVVALAIGGATLADGSDPSQEPVKDPSPSPEVEKVETNPDSVRQLTYALGDTIHYGERSVHVGEEVQFVDVTDDGVVFVRGKRFAQPGANALWFTDGSGIERIGTVTGSPSRGYGVASSDAGSILVWPEPVDDTVEVVVFDTEATQVLTRLPTSAPGLGVLSVQDDAVYWAPEDASCELPGDGRHSTDCLRFESVMKYDVATDSTEQVSGAAYNADRRSRTRTVVGPYRGDAQVPGTFAWDDITFDLQGTDLVAHDFGGVVELTVSEGRSGVPIDLRIPTESRSSTSFALTQWLDDDRFALFAYAGRASEFADEGEIFTCSLSRGTCRPEPGGEPGSLYQVPRLD